MDVGRQQTSDTGWHVLSAERTKGHYCVAGMGSLESDSRVYPDSWQQAAGGQ